MTADGTPELTERQARELEYHRERARQKADELMREPVALDVVREDTRRWWNHYWHLYTQLRDADLSDKRVLVVGCGFGEDAIRLSHLSRHVSAFDLSDASLEVARARAASQAGSAIDFRQSAAESLPYDDGVFDLVLCVDILHHCDIPATMRELRRVSRPGALFVADEVFTHSALQRIRESEFVNERVYPTVKRVIYGGDVYITEDERKLNERDLDAIRAAVDFEVEDYFNFLSTRVIPSSVPYVERFDRALLRLSPRVGRLLGNRVIVVGRLKG